MTTQNEAAPESPELTAITKIQAWQSDYRTMIKALISGTATPDQTQILIMLAAASLTMSDLVVLVMGAAQLPRPAAADPGPYPAPDVPAQASYDSPPAWDASGSLAPPAGR